MNLEAQQPNYELDNSELNKLYDEGEQCDQRTFSEMRSNLLMIHGDHYNKKKRKYFVNRVRENNSMSEDMKLRLTKNHTGKIHDIYINNITSNTPGVIIVPNNDKEIQDQKSAKQNGAVWKRATIKHKVKKKIREFASDFTGTGEVACRIIWDPTKGKLQGYEPLIEQLPVPQYDEMGNVVTERQVLDEMGQPKPDKDSPVMSGDFEFRRVYGFNLIRPKEAKDMNESEWLCEREMADIRELKKVYKNDPKKLKYIQESEDETFLVFDGNNNSYQKSDNETLLLNFFFRPCLRYPNGYFVIKTKSGILEQGELPYSIFPIVYQNFKQLQTSPRGRSKFSDGKPYQIEINRCASAIATHQVTLGDDKLVGNTMGKVEHSAQMPGVRFIKVNAGGTLQHLPGRTGDQYLPYMNSQIQEYYSVMMLAEEAIDKEEFTGDAFASLFRSLKQKKKFSIYIEKFEEFLVDICQLYLQMAKVYLPDEEIIAAIGRDDAVNLQEFRSSEPLSYQINVEPNSGDVETQYGQQLVFNQILQYTGGSLERKDIGKIIKSMPLANVGDSFEDFLMDEQNADNLVLALERGEEPVVSRFDDNVYMMQRIVNRMRKPDFQYLQEEIQQAFEAYYEAYSEQEVAKQQELQSAQSGYIPTGGYTVKADLYVTDENGKNKRAELPYESINWLIEKLEQQGMSQASIESLNEQAKLELAQQMNQGAMSPPAL